MIRAGTPTDDRPVPPGKGGPSFANAFSEVSRGFIRVDQQRAALALRDRNRDNFPRHPAGGDRLGRGFLRPQREQKTMLSVPGVEALSRWQVTVTSNRPLRPNRARSTVLRPGRPASTRAC